MLIFIDLDGSITDTTHPSWALFQDGQAEVPKFQVPFFLERRIFWIFAGSRVMK